jgi:hypothetical protein
MHCNEWLPDKADEADNILFVLFVRRPTWGPPEAAAKAQGSLDAVLLSRPHKPKSSQKSAEGLWDQTGAASKGVVVVDAATADWSGDW